MTSDNVYRYGHEIFENAHYFRLKLIINGVTRYLRIGIGPECVKTTNSINGDQRDMAMHKNPSELCTVFTLN